MTLETYRVLRKWRWRSAFVLMVEATVSLLPSVVAADAVFVRAGATGLNDGSSWTDAFTDLQQGLAASSSGDEIWVAAGTYTPGPPGDALSSFVMIDGVALYGGFSGNETVRDQRNWTTNITILSGDVGHDDEFSPVWNIHTANSGHVVVGSGVGAGAILDGFTIMSGHTGPAGTPAGDPLMYGSGLYVIAGSPTVRNCTFMRNVAAFAAGGAIYCQDASPTITRCKFVQNWVHLGNGGGIAVVGNAVPSISDCHFAENRAIADSGNTGQGAALSVNFLTAPLDLTVLRCVFEYNTAQTFYPVGGIEIARGGGISNFGASLTARDCIFRFNSANAGAAIQTWDPAVIVNCLFHDNHVYSHDSGAGGDGGYGAGICIYSFQPDVATIINSTIADNTGSEGVGVQSLGNSSFNLRNSVVWGNIASGGEVSPIDAQLKGDWSAEYSCVQDLLTPVPGEDPPHPANYPGCIVSNPQFASSSVGDYRPGGASPCIDAGRNSFVPGGITLDLAQLPRFQDSLDVVDTGHGTPPIVDMGAYEFFSFAAGDVNCDGLVDLADVDVMAAVLVGVDVEPCHVVASDVDGSGLGDGLDVQSLVDLLIE